MANSNTKDMPVNPPAVWPVAGRTINQGVSSLAVLGVGLGFLVFAGSAQAAEDPARVIADLQRQIIAQQQQLDAQGRQLAKQADLLNKIGRAHV